MRWTDIRYAFRLMRRSPGFTAVAILSLGLGIGFNTALYSLFYTVVLRTMPVAHPEQLVEPLQKYPGEPRGNGYWSWSSYEHFRDHNHVFSAVTGMSFDSIASVRAEGAEPETLILENVLGNYFQFFGLRPALCRLITPEDVPARGDGGVVVISWSLWSTRLHRDPGVVGKRIWVNDVPKEIIGVAPRSYTGPRVGVRTDIWMPREKDNAALLFRLKSGATIEQARAEMAVLFRFSIEERAARSKDPLLRQMTVDVEPAATGLARVRDQYGKPLALLMAAVGVLLLLACVNVAGMLLARSATRQRELAVRVGLGASRSRLIGQMVTESLLLSGAGTLVGVILAYLGTGVLMRILASGRTHERLEIEVQPDLHLLLFTVGAAILTGLLFGSAPAWYAFRSAPATHLRQNGTARETWFWRLFGKGLVSTQVALSILLVTAAAIFLTHVSRLRNFDLGFRRDHVLLLALDAKGGGYQRAQLTAPYQELLARFETVPGVRSASISGCTPIEGCGASRFVIAEGHAERPEDRRFTALSWVSPRYFETLGIPLLAGRDFSFGDAGRSRVTIISEAMAQHHFTGANPIGKRIAIDRDLRTGGWYGSDQPYEVVGVVGDVKQTELREPPPRTMYLNMFQENQVFHQFALRTRVDPTSLAPSARQLVRDVLPTVRVARVTTLSDQLDAAIVPERLIATLSSCFGLFAAVLAGIGLYGLLAFTVARRTGEIGVRLALGATVGAVRRLVLRDVLLMVFAGMAAGTLLVLWTKPIAASLIQDLKQDSPWPLFLGGTALVGVALLASYVPLRLAARVDPVVALRHE